MSDELRARVLEYRIRFNQTYDRSEHHAGCQTRHVECFAFQLIEDFLIENAELETKLKHKIGAGFAERLRGDEPPPSETGHLPDRRSRLTLLAKLESLEADLEIRDRIIKRATKKNPQVMYDATNEVLDPNHGDFATKHPEPAA